MTPANLPPARAGSGRNRGTLWRSITGKPRLGGVIAALLVVAGTTVAQRTPWRGGEEASDSTPAWRNDPEFSHDLFTFVRIRYDSIATWHGYEKWRIDYPDADLNLSYRLQQLTSWKVFWDPRGKVMELTDPHLVDYPFIYIVEPGDMRLHDEEVKALRQYLLSGGFLMVDDFWGEREWQNFYLQIKRVFPDREPEDLPLSHPIFHSVFDLKEKPQIPNVRLGTQSQIPGSPYYGITWERPDAQEPHYRGIYDDQKRLMVVICHNTDLGDGWEREGDNELYFREFSEKKAYPLGINIIFYAMTH
jgi:hypothetical protein